jgi:hypothetical protein
MKVTWEDKDMQDDNGAVLDVTIDDLVKFLKDIARYEKVGRVAYFLDKWKFGHIAALYALANRIKNTGKVEPMLREE